MRESDRRALGVFERKVLRSILGGKLEEGVWRRRMNHELYQVYKDADIVKRIKHGRLQWAGHVFLLHGDQQAEATISKDNIQQRPR